MKNSILITLFGAAMIAAIPAQATTVNFNFTTDANSTGNAFGNSLTFGPTSGSITGLTGVTVSSFSTKVLSTTGSTALFSGAIDNYAGANLGLGVCGQNETAGCGSPQHQVDNIDNGYEFVLFKFSTAVDLKSIVLNDYSGSDMDLSYWTGNTAPAGATLSALLGSVGAQTNDICSGGTSVCGTGKSITDSLTTNGTDVKYLLVAAGYGLSSADTFKIGQLNVASPTLTSAPEPATFGLIGFALTGLGLLARKRKQN